MTTEQEIEKFLVDKLSSEMGYTYREDINDRESLEKNFRKHFEELNHVHLTDNEFKRLLDYIVTPDVFTASRMLREQNNFERDNGTSLTYILINTKDWCKNTFEVINQLRINTDYSHHRYDVILLMNGIPVVQIELKTLDVTPRRAMRQIVDYKKDPGNGYGKTLMCFLQLFIVSNRNDTLYFANNNEKHFAFDVDEGFLPIYRHADRKNKKIACLDDFAEIFLEKCTLGQTISRYVVLVESERKLIMMRPYQIYAVQAIVECIKQNCGNGYIWHTTGSGKTLTSFKASTLLKENPDIEKCLFVVDRKDLDRQTREEFNRFQEGCVEENTNTRTLVRRLLSRDYADKVIVTTIQKLGLALNEANRRNYKEQLEPLRDKRIAFIFDECHRSQFGDNHEAIRDFFPQAQMFGFTGTPIFEENATTKTIKDEQERWKTTEEIFPHRLHEYTITHAIEDKNVLRFHVDYFKPEDESEPTRHEKMQAIVEEILSKHDAATNKRKFNAIMATASINDAIEYYKLFKDIQKRRNEPDFRPLNVACVFSPPADGDLDVQQLQEDLPQEQQDNTIEPDKKKKALQAIIQDYNRQYETNHSITEFDSYYQDVQKRIKDQQYPTPDLPHGKKIDITIVVDMLLTGFDSKFLNTLYVDKNLKHHGLIQAFSRTNRVLNDSKPYGNILEFRKQQDNVHEAITMFAGEKSDRKAREIWLVEPAPKVIKKLEGAVEDLNQFMQSQGLDSKPTEVPNLKGNEAKAMFVRKYKEVQRIQTQLEQYTDLTPQQRDEIRELPPPEYLQGFKAAYLEMVQNLKQGQIEIDGEDDSEVQQLDFELVLFASEMIDYDYIMKLIANYSGSAPGKQEMTREELVGLIRSDAKFMDQSDDLVEYINTLEQGKGLNEKEIRAGYEDFKNEKHAKAMAEIAEEHNLDEEMLQNFFDGILKRKIFDDRPLTELIDPLNLGWKARIEKKRDMMRQLRPLFRKRNVGRAISGLNTYEN